MGVVIHAKARRVGNSWAIIIPKDKAEELNLKEGRTLHVEIETIKRLAELKGKIKFKESIEELMKEIDEGWE